jgi:hypothetical protein
VFGWGVFGWGVFGQAVGLGLFLAAVGFAGGDTSEVGGRGLAARAAGLAAALEQQVENMLARIEPVARRVATGEPVDWRSFSRALDPGDRRRDKGLIVWAPHVSAADRAEYELQTGRDSYRSFNIRDADGRGGLRPAASRREHFPVHLVEPPTESNRILGLDLLSEPALTEAVVRASGSLAPQVVLPGSDHGFAVGMPGWPLGSASPIASQDVSGFVGDWAPGSAVSTVGPQGPFAFVPNGAPGSAVSRAGSGFVGSGFVGSRFVGSGFVGSRFVGSGFVGSRFVGSRLVGSRFVGSGEPQLVIVLPVARGGELRGLLVAMLPLSALLSTAERASLGPDIAVRLAPWSVERRPRAGSTGRWTRSARAPFRVLGRACALEIAAGRP